MIVQLVSKISNLCDPDPPTSQTDGQTDRQTDGRTTCNLNTALCTSASRGKKYWQYSWRYSKCIADTSDSDTCIAILTTLLCGMYFSKRYTVCGVQWGLWQRSSNRSWGVFENFCVVRLLLGLSYKKMGQQDVLLPHAIILLGEQPSVRAPMKMVEQEAQLLL